MAKQIFVNLPIKNLQKSIDFFSHLGFGFNLEFTDKKATCMIIGENIFAMLLVEDFFKTFTKKQIADTTKTIEAIMAVSVESREKVDELAKKAVEAGGKIHREPQDYGWMYGQSIEDIDGHIWEVFWMDESKRQRNN